MEDAKQYVGDVPAEVFTEKEDKRDLSKVSDDATLAIVEKLKKFPLKTVTSKLIILPEEAEAMTKGGVILPDMAQEAPARGKVVARGNGYITAGGTIIKLTCQIGDVVIYPKYGGHKFEYDDKEYIVIDEKDLLAIIGE